MDKFAQNLDWNLLYTFLIVVQNQSITKAANQLSRTQPAVSIAIKKLEEFTGAKLVQRKGNGLHITQAGKALYEEASKVYASISRLPLVLEHAPNSLEGKITLATIDLVEDTDFNLQLTNFFRKYPAVRLEIEVATTADVIRMVEIGEATLGISDGVIPDSLNRRLLMTEQFGLYCGTNYHLAGRDDISVRDLRGEPFIGFTGDILGGNHMGNVTAFRASASMGQYVRAQSSYVNEVKRMISCGIGIGFLPIHLADPFVERGDLFRLPPYEDEPTSNINLISNPATTLSAAEQMFFEYIDL